MITPDKPFKTYDQMLSLLQARGLVIKNKDFAIKSLSFTSYYTLINGYQDSIIYDKNRELFRPGVTFNDLYALHILDSSINHTLLKYILHIEGALKSRVSYIVSKNHGVWTDIDDSSNINCADYLFRGNYSANTGRKNELLRRLKKCVQNPETTAYSILHYKMHHNHIPPWILSTGLCFYQAIQWFEILNSNDKSYVVNEFIPFKSLTEMEKKEFLRLALELLRDVRNRIAHGAPLLALKSKYSVPKKQTILLSNGIIETGSWKNLYARCGLWPVIAVIFILLPDLFLKRSFINEFEGIIQPYIDQNISIVGFSMPHLFHLPEDILQRLERALPG